jgi:predicted GNAT family acetyltransferase
VIAVKKLEEDRWMVYRDLRLEALKKEPIAFGSSYDEEKNISEEEWRERIGNVLFALSKDKLVGIIVFVQGDKIKAKHIYNIYGVYVTEGYRGQGVVVN